MIGRESVGVLASRLETDGAQSLLHRRLPDLCMTTANASTITSTEAPSGSLIASGLPRHGTCTMSMPASFISYAPFGETGT
jgi:hypothetical protein